MVNLAKPESCNNQGRVVQSHRETLALPTGACATASPSMQTVPHRISSSAHWPLIAYQMIYPNQSTQHSTVSNIGSKKFGWQGGEEENNGQTDQQMHVFGSHRFTHVGIDWRILKFWCIFFYLYPGTWPSYLMALLSRRIVRQVGARI